MFLKYFQMDCEKLKKSRFINLNNDESIDAGSWLTDINIDLALEYFQKKYSSLGFNIITMAEQAVDSSDFNRMKWTFENKPNLILLYCHDSHWVVVTNINTNVSNENLLLKNKPIFVYDSLNSNKYINGVQPILVNMFPESNFHVIHKVKMRYPQDGYNDCGLFALAYVESILNMTEPSLIKYNQRSMRIRYNDFIQSDLNNFNMDILEINSSIKRRIKPYYVIINE
jgi:hypothetical protein